MNEINKLEIYKKEYNRLLAFAIARSNGGNAEDILQKTFIYLNNKKEFNDAEHVRRWLMWVVKHECYVNNRKVSRYVQIDQQEFDNIISDEKNPSEIASYEDLKLKILDKLPQKLKLLPRLQRNCLELYYLKGKGRQEISLIEKTTVNAVSAAISKATRSLKEIFAKDNILM
jgi:RNA polymerase sigma factor (sigma-70 family)